MGWLFPLSTMCLVKGWVGKGKVTCLGFCWLKAYSSQEGNFCKAALW